MRNLRRTALHSQERSGAARVFAWPRCGGCVTARQNAGASYALNRLRHLHAVLFHQGRTVRLTAGALDCPRRLCGFAGDKNDHEIHWGLAAVPRVLHALARGQLNRAAHVHRTDLRHNLRPVRPAKQDYHSGAILRAGDGRNPERIRAHAHRPEVFPAVPAHDERVGPALSTKG